VIYNGYDEDDFDEIDDSTLGAQPFTISYLGTWGGGRSPELFLRAVSRLLAVHPNLKDRIRVNFVGEVKFDPEMHTRIEWVISEESLDGVVKMIPFLPYRRGLDLLRHSDVCLLVVSRFHSQVGCLSSKLFEYLYAGKPILALAPSESEEAQIICKAGAGQVVDPDDTTAISRKIEEMYMAFQNGDALCDVDFCAIKKYERKRQTHELAEIFDSLTAMRGTPKTDIYPA
jgi:glycosyltransferase involved in cell wall biosynthesis